MNILELKRYDDLDYSLIYREGITLTPFVCAWNPTYNDDGTISQWSQGHYFKELDSAVSYINDLRKSKQSAFEQYKHLSSDEINNLRKYSCFNAVFETSSSTMSDEDVEKIGLFAYNTWIESSSDIISPEDIAIFTTRTLMNNKHFSLDDIKDLIDDDLFVGYDGDLSALEDIIKNKIEANFTDNSYELSK